MPNKKTPLEQRLINAMKDAGFATKKDVEDIVHEQLTEYHHNMAEPEFNKVNKKLGKVEDRLDQVEVRLNKVEDQFDGLKAEFSGTPSKKEFNQLKDRVDKYHPLN